MDLLGVTAEVHDLKGTVYSKSAKINELEDKITKLMVENQKVKNKPSSFDSF
jgi:predicted  nucleic acid-binding Zn-ribbon protein